MNLLNDHIYAWRVDKGLEQFLPNLSVFRHMDYSHRRGANWCRTIFRGPFYDGPFGVNAGEFINSWPVDCAIELRILESGRPDDPDNGQKLVVFQNCIPLCRWIPNLVAAKPNDTGIVMAYVDVECLPTWHSGILKNEPE